MKFGFNLLIVLGLIACAYNCDAKSHKSQLSSSLKSSKDRNSRLISTAEVLDNKKTVNSHVPVISQAQTANDKLRGFACVLGGALAHLTLGTLYCWGNFISYAPENLKFFDGKDHPGVPPDALYIIPFTLVAQAIAMPFGPSIVKRIGASGTLLLGSWITAAAVYLASYQKSLATFMAAYSLLFGAGVGFAYTAPMAAGWKWLPNMKGLVSGGILTGFGAGGFIFSMIGSKSVNPTGANPINGKFPASVYASFPGMLRKLAVLYAIISFVGSMLVTEPKAVATSPATAPVLKAAAAQPAAATANGLTLPQALSSRQFWQMWSMIICSATAGLNTAAIYKQYAATSSALTGDGFQALVGGVGALFNGFGRLFWGSVSDIIGFKNSFMILTALQASLMYSYAFSTFSKAAFAINTWLLFFCLAGNLALMPPATQRMFGPLSGTVIYGVLYSSFAIASILGGILTKSLVKTAGWGRVFQVMTAMSIAACALVSKLSAVSSYSGSVV